MKRVTAVLSLVVLATLVACGATGTLDIYFIDVEGGQATLIVTPSGTTMLVDAGFPGSGTFGSRPGDPALARDPQRIKTVATVAGVTSIDYLLVTHFHADHVGGVVELSQLLPIGTFIDHGDVTADADAVAGTKAIFADYAAVRAHGQHLQPRAGDRLPLTDVDVTIVATEGQTFAVALPGASGAANPACPATGLPAQEVTENPRSTGFLLQYGAFRFLDVGDLTGDPLFALGCPIDRIGVVDAYLVSHHGGADAAEPSLFAALKPRVAIVNNSRTKGGAASTLRTLQAATDTQTWQLHLSAASDDAGTAPNTETDRIANLDDTTTHWLKLSAQPDGSFTLTNSRTRQSTTYAGLRKP